MKRVAPHFLPLSPAARRAIVLLASPVLTLLAMIVLQWLEENVFKVPNQSAFYLAVVLYFAIRQGVWSGLISAGVTLGYNLIFFSIPGHLFTYDTSDQVRWWALAIVTPVFAVLVGTLQQRTAQQWRALRESGARIAAIMDSTADGIITFDAQGLVESFNGAAERIFGYTAAEIVGHSVEQLRTLPPTPAEADPLASLLVLPQGPLRGASRTIMGRRKDGSPFPLEISLSRTWLGQRGVYISVVRDVTTRQAAETALRESEERLRMLVHNAPLVLFAADPAGQITLSVGKGLAALGRKDGEAVGRSIHDLYRDVPAALEGMRCALAGEQVTRLVEAGAITFETIFTPLRAADGTISGLIGVALDITERQRAAAALRESEERFAKAFRASPVAISVTQAADGRFLEVNDAFVALLGYQQEEVIGGRSKDLGIWNDAERARVIQTLQEQHSLRDFETRLRTRSGEYIDVLAGLEQIDLGGEPCLLALWYDISTRKQAEAALQAANAQLTGSVAELERRTREITLLREVGELLQSCITAEEAHTALAQAAVQLFPGVAGAISMISASGNLVELVTSWGTAPPGEKVFGTADCWALRRGRLHQIDAAHFGLRCRHHRALLPGGAYLCVPLMAQGEALGILHLYFLAPPSLAEDPAAERRRESQQQIAQTFAEHIALALANLKLRTTLQGQAIRDPLTGLFNRSYMEVSLEREIHRAARNHTSLGVIMLDLDHFKRFNDTFGHAAGDVLLRELGGFLQMHIRAEDIACRYGGEEFALVLPDASLADAQRRAEQLLQTVSQLNVQYRGQMLGTITMSLGVAGYPALGTTGEALLQGANAALYQAKAEGRNRVVIAAEATRKPA